MSAPSGGVTATTWRGCAAVALANECLEVVITCGGGNIVSMRALGVPGAESLNVMWEPPWQTTHPALRRLTAPVICKPGELEGELLAGVGGTVLCADVFGEHSAGEVASGLCYHGEAGLTTWEVESSDGDACVVVLVAHLRRSMLTVRRHISLIGAALNVREELTNLCSFERALGRTLHVTVGANFLGDADGSSCHFRASCDMGHTWPTDHDEDGALGSRWQPNTKFEYPHVPTRAGGGEDDWRIFPAPHAKGNSDLATMRVSPSDDVGWFVAQRSAAHGGAPALVFAAAWERAAFPWLMTWEENRARRDAPWSGRTLCRGLEISSYACAPRSAR